MSDEALLHVLDALNSLKTRYVVSGSLASNLYGIARLTLDADLIVEIDSAELSELARRLPPRIHLDPQMAFETVTGTCRYVVTNQDTRFKVELFLLSDDPFDQERFRRRVPIVLQGKEAFVTSAEDVVIQKVRWLKRQNRTKDHDDLIGVLSVSGEKLDWPYLERWCREHGTWELLNEVRAKAPHIP